MVRIVASLNAALLKCGFAYHGELHFRLISSRGGLGSMGAGTVSSILRAAFLRKAVAVSLAGALTAVAPVTCWAEDTTAQPHPTVVFMTDFGVIDDSVALCKGVMYSVAPELRIVDLTHQVTAFSILDGARYLEGASPYFPAGTVFVTVIDPGVGSARKAVVVKSKRGQYFVLPDNGLMTLVQDRDGIEAAREITNRSWMIGAGISSTFHGRDIFSPVGAHVARGDDWAQVGPEVPVDNLVRLNLTPPKLVEHGLSGEVLALDGAFGNLVTNISRDEFSKLGYKLGEKVHVTIGKTALDLPFVRTFSDVAAKQPLLYIDSREKVSFAVNLGSFAGVYHVKPPAEILISAAKH
jgi:S-adenosylmethionine hydrolase